MPTTQEITVEEGRLEDLVHELSHRLSTMEQQIRAIQLQLGQTVRPAAPPVPPPQAAAPAPAPIKKEEGISEEVLMVMAAAVAAFLGRKARIRRVRRLSEPGANPWSQQGRVSIQASHNVHWPRA